EAAALVGHDLPPGRLQADRDVGDRRAVSRVDDGAANAAGRLRGGACRPDGADEAGERAAPHATSGPQRVRVRSATTCPPFITQRTPSINAFTSASGSPSTATRSAK